MPSETAASREFSGENLLVGVVRFRLLNSRRGLAAVERVEAARDLAGELHVGDLILSDGNEVRLVEQDVGGLKQRIAEEAVGVEVLLAELLLLVLVGRHALEPAAAA